jgi:hypothetical protein
MRYLSEHGSKPEFVTRFSWQPGSIAFWDNRQMWYLAVNGYHGMRRVMNRILLTGDETGSRRLTRSPLSGLPVPPADRPSAPAGAPARARAVNGKIFASARILEDRR